jgi:hypothetical protein
VLSLNVGQWNHLNIYIYIYSILFHHIDISTCVGYYVVSRPFLDPLNTRHANSTYNQILEVIEKSRISYAW